MLLYRAINDFNDEINIENGHGIQSSIQETKETCLKTVSSHIASGSNAKNKDGWISTTKDFKICSGEFSIPQMGGYNTAAQRKRIAVINRYEMLTTKPNYTPNSNYTYISDGQNELDLCDSNRWPIAIKPGLHKTKEIVFQSGEKVKVNNELTVKYVNWFNNFFNSLQSIETFILDMTFPSPSDRGSKYAAPSEFSFYDYIGNGIISKGKSMPIISGCIKNHSEVLVLNEIPHKSIIKVLTLVEIDILYALDNDDFRNVINDIISGKIMVDIQGQNIIINGKQLSLNVEEQCLVDEIYNKNTSMIDLTYRKYEDGGGNNALEVLNIYYDLKELKRGVIKKALNKIGLESTVSIIEDEVFVAIKNSQQTNNQQPNLELCKYDLLLIGDEKDSTVYKFGDQDYDKIWEKSVENNFIIKNNSGNLTNCRLKR